MDGRVIALPWPLRAFLVHGLIVPFRSSQSAHAYQKIWTEDGSPLKVYTFNTADQLSKLVGDDCHIEVGMRYGEPSLEESWRRLKKKEPSEVLIAPLYPQYASATTGSSLEKIFRLLQKENYIPSIKVLPPFYAEPAWIQTFALGFKDYDLSQYDHVLFSFHGLPESHLLDADSSAQHCLKRDDCCEQVPSYCYRAQCFKTAQLIQQKLNLHQEKCSVSFQSRLGKQRWLKPYTDQHLRDLARQGVKNLLVACPSFVSDCLETLEEIGMQGRNTFLKAGGQRFDLVACPNDRPEWASALFEMLKKN